MKSLYVAISLLIASNVMAQTVDDFKPRKPFAGSPSAVVRTGLQSETDGCYAFSQTTGYSVSTGICITGTNGKDITMSNVRVIYSKYNFLDEAVDCIIPISISKSVDSRGNLSKMEIVVSKYQILSLYFWDDMDGHGSGVFYSGPQKAVNGSIESLDLTASSEPFKRYGTSAILQSAEKVRCRRL